MRGYDKEESAGIMFETVLNVERYKKIFALWGKTGYKDATEVLFKRL